ncbi:hypothetical protein B0T14DRAFT_434998 [Immersiella caudata]|uniref:Delta(24)-sterol reductase n=1 Tax=Immersiella caudata TaxID=314043 RepID=A0AA39WL46_9PEZI|nr:hypothetical protein B0T14DRAFT_434998 [Immersiella caudata]
MARHEAAVAKIAGAVRAFFERGEPYRIFHGSTNSTRPRPGQRTVDISALSNVLKVDPAKRIALVEPNVPMDRLVEATLPHGLIPPIVMEFPGITAGGGFAGTAGESSSFRHGFFNDTVNRVEMVLADGTVTHASRSPSEHPDLFHGAAGAVGSLGITTLLELNLSPAKRYVHTRYHRATSVTEAIATLRRETANPANDYVDGIVYSPSHAVIITGTLTDSPPAPSSPLQTFSSPWDPWFYLHAQSLTSNPTPTPPENHIPLAEYLFRYDRGGFWVGAAAFQYFSWVPFTRLTRWFLDDFLHTRMMYRALHGSGESARFIVQDIAMPFKTTPKFIEYTTESLGIWPLWLCPLQRRGPPTFHPFTTTPKELLKEREGEDEMMLNVGVWGWGPKEPREFVRKNRELEAKVRELGGMKWLYAHTYYEQEEFWKMYGGREWYDALREKYKAGTLPSVWDKVHVDAEAAGGEKRHWLKRQVPIGGLYGIWKSIQSKDYFLHRNAKWKWKGEGKE